MVVISHGWFLKLNVSFLVTQATFQMFKSCMWLVAAILDDADYKTFPPLKKVSCTRLI